MSRKITVFVLALACIVAPLPWRAASAAAPKLVDTWAWCGVHPDDPVASAAARSMAIFSGIDATFGPCKDGPPGYTPAEPGDRYVTPELYMRLVRINASVGMKTVVYDKRVWSDDPAVRTSAKNFWRPVYEHIAAWDMGDEFDPNSAEWAILIHRTQVVLEDVAVDSFIQPFSNHLVAAIEEAIRDIPENDRLLSFDQYFGDQGVAAARSVDALVDVLMCAVNMYQHFVFFPTAEMIRDDTRRLVAAGCDMILVFGGAQVYGSSAFGPFSIIDRAGNPTDWGTAALESTGSSNYVPVSPARLLETRVGAGLSTVDGLANGVGVLPAGTTTELQVSGRANVRADAASVVLTVTAINAVVPGFVSVYPCGTNRPNVAQVNHPARSNVATAVVVKLPSSGKVCLFNLAQLDLVIDVTGYHPPGTTFVAVQPARLLETRVGPGMSTVDGNFAGVGFRGAGSVTQLTVAGRAGVPVGASAATLSVTVISAGTAGFVTVFPCQQAVPAASSVNFGAGQVVTNAVVSGLAAEGWVCLYTSADVDVVVDVNGYNPGDASFVALVPQRILDSRTAPGPKPRPASMLFVPIRELQITGTAGIPASASSVVVNLTVTQSTGSGFVTVFPCGATRPNSSNVNFVAGETVSNMVVAEIGRRGTICLYSPSDPDYVIDITAYHP